MRKVLISICIIMATVSFSGCTSYVVGKYDDYNDTFVGTSNYDPLIKKALVEVISTKNKTKCIGQAEAAKFPAYWKFDLVCNDGRNIMGTIADYETESYGFTNRNENVTFSVVKKQSTLTEIHRNYVRQTANKPLPDNTIKPFGAKFGI